MEVSVKRRSYILSLLRPGLDEAAIPASKQDDFINACLLQIRQMRETYLPDRIFDIARRIEHLSRINKITTKQATDALMDTPALLFRNNAPILRKEYPAPAVAQETAESMPEKPAAPSAAHQKTSSLEFEIAALLLGRSITGRSAGSAEKSPPDTDTTYTPLQKRYLHLSAR